MYVAGDYPQAFSGTGESKKEKKEKNMVITVPIVQKRLSQHFGHCETFRFYYTDKDNNIINTEEKTPPPHEPGVLPKWLSEEGADVIITGGMGMHAQRLFSNYGIEVVLGAPAEDPGCVVKEWIGGNLQTGENPCDH